MTSPISVTPALKHSRPAAQGISAAGIITRRDSKFLNLKAPTGSAILILVMTINRSDGFRVESCPCLGALLPPMRQAWGAWPHARAGPQPRAPLGRRARSSVIGPLAPAPSEPEDLEASPRSGLCPEAPAPRPDASIRPRSLPPGVRSVGVRPGAPAAMPSVMPPRLQPRPLTNIHTLPR